MMNNCPHIKIQLWLKGDKLLVENKLFWQNIKGKRREIEEQKMGVSTVSAWIFPDVHIQCT